MDRTRPQIIRHGRLLDPETGTVAPADVLVLAGRVAEVGQSGMAAPEGAELVDATDRLLHPGLVNGHTHGYGHLSRSLTDDVTLETLIAAAPWSTGNRTHEDTYLSTLVGAAEMALKGCTACWDMFLEIPAPSPEGLDAVTRAYAEVGLRAVVAPMVSDFPFFRAIPALLDALPPELRSAATGFAGADTELIFTRLGEIVRGWRHDPERIALALAPTIPLLCSDRFLIGCDRIARDHGLVMQTHLSESKVQEVAARSRWGRSLTAHLHRLEILSPRLSAAHGVWLGDEDMARLADAGVHVVLNVGSNMRLGSGLPDMRRLLDHGVAVGIGTDASSCSDNQNMYEAMRLAAYASHVSDTDYRRWVSSHEAVRAATIGSAGALGMAGIGRIAPGAHADIVFLDLSHIHWIPCRNALHQFVQAEDATAVRDVMIGGRWVVRDRQLLTVDLAALRSRVEAAVERLDRVGAENRRQFRAIQPIVGAHCSALARTPYPIHRLAGHACCA